MNVSASTIQRKITLDVTPDEAKEICDAITTIDVDTRSNTYGLRILYGALAAVRDGRELGGH